MVSAATTCHQWRARPHGRTKGTTCAFHRTAFARGKLPLGELLSCHQTVLPPMPLGRLSSPPGAALHPPRPNQHRGRRPQPLEFLGSGLNSALTLAGQLSLGLTPPQGLRRSFRCAVGPATAAEARSRRRPPSPQETHYVFGPEALRRSPFSRHHRMTCRMTAPKIKVTCVKKKSSVAPPLSRSHCRRFRMRHASPRNTRKGHAVFFWFFFCTA